MATSPDYVLSPTVSVTSSSSFDVIPSLSPSAAGSIGYDSDDEIVWSLSESSLSSSSVSMASSSDTRSSGEASNDNFVLLPSSQAEQPTPSTPSQSSLSTESDLSSSFASLAISQSSNSLQSKQKTSTPSKSTTPPPAKNPNTPSTRSKSAKVPPSPKPGVHDYPTPTPTPKPEQMKKARPTKPSLPVVSQTVTTGAVAKAEQAKGQAARKAAKTANKEAEQEAERKKKEAKKEADKEAERKARRKAKRKAKKAKLAAAAKGSTAGTIQKAKPAKLSGLGSRPIVDDSSEAGDDHINPSMYAEASQYITKYLQRPEQGKERLNRLALLQSLIIELGLTTSTPPVSLTAAQKLLKSRAFINIRDYLEKRDQGFKALQSVMHRSRSALVRNIRTSGKKATLQWVKDHGLQALLVTCFH